MSQSNAALAERIAEHLPSLRRYARALAGSQEGGDAHVAAFLEALIEEPGAVDPQDDVRVAVFAAYRRLWSAEALDPAEAVSALGDDAALEGLDAEETVRRRLARLAPVSRQALLLTALEGFTVEEAARILGMSPEAAAERVAEAHRDLQTQMRARILIIEDEPIIAMDIEATVEELGHSVVASCATRAEAVRAAEAEQPDLVLADIQLADGSSGLEAVRDILAEIRRPIVFVTAYPERLLTARAPEPAFLVPKPFRPETLQAVVSQALFFREAPEFTAQAG